MSEKSKGMIIGGIISTTSFTIGLIMTKLMFSQPIIQFEEYIPPEEPVTMLVVNSKYTNSNERASNVQWFKENNKYIWDGWKIEPLTH